MSQSKTGSMLETIASTTIGYLVAVLSQLLIFPMFGIHVDLAANFAIGAWFTIVSLVRGYCVRRLFNTFRL